MDLLNLKHFTLHLDTAKRVRQATNGEKIFSNYIWTKGWYPECKKNTQKSTIRKQKNPIKISKVFKTNTSPYKGICFKYACERCSVSLIFRKFYIKTTLRYGYISCGYIARIEFAGS